jgi:ABC-type transport system involved in multi-copper enzyme maturation permease subunit
MNTAVFHREMLDALRSTRTVASILALAGIASAIVYLRWPSDSRLDIVSQGSMQVFGPLAYGLAAAVMLLIPAFPATSIVRERRRGTLALLLNSPLRPWEIYVGKLLANMVVALVIVAMCLPALAASYAMGGLTLTDHILPLLAVLCAMSLQYTTLGLLISIRGGSSDSSLRWTYAAVLMVSLLSLAPSAILGGIDTWQGTAARGLTTLSPAGALRLLTGTEAAASDLATLPGWTPFIVAAVVSSCLFAGITLWYLAPLRSDRPKPVGRQTHQRSLGVRILRRASYIVDPESRSAGIPLWINPVMVKEFRTRKFGRLHWLMRLVAICAIVSLLLSVVAVTGTMSWGVERIAGTLVLLQIALLVVLGPSLAAGLIAGEIESGGWQLLRLTPMSALRIVWGKLLSVIWTMALILAATLPGYAVMMWIQPALAAQVVRVILALMLSSLVIVMLSAATSAFWRSAAAATACSYGIVLALFMGTLLVWLARGKPFGHQFVERVLATNPAAAALAEIRAPGFEEYVLVPAAWWIGLGIALGCLLTLSYRTWRLTRPD